MQKPAKLAMLVVDHTGEKLRVITAELERVVGGAGLHVDSGASARARRVRTALRASIDRPVSKVIHCRVSTPVAGLQAQPQALAKIVQCGEPLSNPHRINSLPNQPIALSNFHSFSA